MHVTRGGGATWANVTPKIPGAPKFAYVSKVEPSRADEGTVYVSFDGHRTGDYGTHLYASSDYGATFRSIAANLPKGEVVRTVTEDQKNPDVHYVSTETGRWVSVDRGRAWTRVRANLPTVPVYEITQHARDNAMILATHGRAIWILDDMTLFQSWTQAQSRDAWVYGSRAATLRLPTSDQERGFQGDMLLLGENPPMAATIAYVTRVKPDSVRIEIRDAAGAVVRQVKGDTAKATRPAMGLNIARWDLRIEPLPEPKSGASPAENPFGGGGGGREGPYVLPATYVATVFVNGKSIGATDVVVRSDPESQVATADRKANFELSKELQGINGWLADAVTAVKQVNMQLALIRKELGDSTKVLPAYRASLDTLAKMIAPLKRKFLVRDEGEEIEFSSEMFRQVLTFKLSGLAGDLGGFLSGPTAQNLRTMEELRKEIPESVTETNALVTRFSAFVKQLSDAGVYPVMPKVVK